MRNKRMVEENKVLMHERAQLTEIYSSLSMKNFYLGQLHEG